MRKTPALLIVFLLAAAGPAPAVPPPAPPSAPPLPQKPAERQAFAATVCDEIERGAAANALPSAFIARLIWKESLFDPGAVSPKGAQGIAQFMPETAKLRGLADPFDARAALEASAAYLAELRDSFGNLGLAAAAYNAGEDRVRRWLSGAGSLPGETQDYVFSITGRSHLDWQAENARHDVPAIGGPGRFSDQCRSLVMRELSPQAVEVKRSGWKPWRVVLTGGFSEARALQAFRVIRTRYKALAAEEPLVVRQLNRSMGRRKMVRIMAGRDGRQEARTLCLALQREGGVCLVAKNGR